MRRQAPEEQIAEIRTSIERKQEKRQRDGDGGGEWSVGCRGAGPDAGCCCCERGGCLYHLGACGATHALGPSRSGTSIESRRRLRLLRELEATVDELEESGYKDERDPGR